MGERTAYADGAWAHDDGQPPERNPYEPGTKAYDDWRDGWRDSARHAEANPDADDE